jgi:phosphatidylserine/phosphatidylglycerophosphate/cardiolipin synthase-like enzyme
MFKEVLTGQGAAVFVPDSAYPDQLIRLIDQARERIWCSVFIVEIDPLQDPDQKVAGILRRLAGACWRGVDVRLLIGGSRTNLQIAEVVAAAADVARQLGIPTRTFGAGDQRGSHVKLVVADDWALTGSHNWSGGAFSLHIQDSLAVQSPDLAAYLANLFLEQWRRSAPPEVKP